MTTTPLEISPQDVESRRAAGDAFVLLDCRRTDEHAFARIDGARLVPMDALDEHLPALDPHRADLLVVYCHHGVRSRMVAGALRRLGFPHATSMAGGIDRWSREIDPDVPTY